MVSLIHQFLSGKADGTDATLVKPSNWNAEHKFETAADGVILGRSPAAGPGPVQELPYTSVFPAGMIMPFAGPVAPTGWLLCQGQLLVRTDYEALFNTIGSTFNIGGETTAQFRLPDLRGRVLAGVDAGAGRLPSWVLGSAAGASTHALQPAENAMHAHGVYDAGHSHFVTPAGGGTFVTINGGNAFLQQIPAMSGPQLYVAAAEADLSTTNISIQNSGSGLAHNNVQPTMALNYLIKT